MITCINAKQLFDRYLDGELSSSLQAELHAHRLNCSHCQQDLAIREACGDVIRMDEREPRLDGSFTNRVMLAYRTQTRPTGRKWQRIARWGGSGLAAAASIGLAVMFIMTPQTPDLTRTEVAPFVEAAPKPVRELLIAKEGTQMTDAAKEELEAAPQMGAANFTSLLTPIVDQAQRTFTSARRGTEELQLLVQMGISAAAEKLDTATQSDTKTMGTSEPSEFDPSVPVLDPFGPTPMQEPTDASASGLPNAL
jgi:hypothetical protein